MSLPLGFLSQVVTEVKIFLQSGSTSSDGAIQSLLKRLNTGQHSESNFFIGVSKNSKVEIHGFSSASQIAIAAGVFIRVKDTESDTRITFICSKTRVASIKKLTILSTGAFSGGSLSGLLRIKELPVFLWTNSLVTLVWITSHTSRWKEFVRNRVIIFQELVPQGQ